MVVPVDGWEEKATVEEKQVHLSSLAESIEKVFFETGKGLLKNNWNTESVRKGEKIIPKDERNMQLAKHLVYWEMFYVCT